MLTYIANHSKYFVLLFAAAITYPMLFKRRKKAGFGNAFGVFLWCLYFTVLGLVATMLLAAVNSLLRGEKPAIGSIAICGEFIFLPIGIWAAAKIKKIKPAVLFDNYIVCAVPVLALMRVNCLFAGCCKGIVLPGTEFRVPTRELEIAFFLIMWIILLKREKQNALEGSAFPLLMASYGVFRFFIEGFREAEEKSIFHLNHLWALLIAIVGIAVLSELKNRAKRNKNR